MVSVLHAPPSRQKDPAGPRDRCNTPINSRCSERLQPDPADTASTGVAAPAIELGARWLRLHCGGRHGRYAYRRVRRQRSECAPFGMHIRIAQGIAEVDPVEFGRAVVFSGGVHQSPLELIICFATISMPATNRDRQYTMCSAPAVKPLEQCRGWRIDIRHHRTPAHGRCDHSKQSDDLDQVNFQREI